MNNAKIGTFIKQLRKEKKLTQKDLANKLGITDRAISKWERGLGCPDISLLEPLANALNITVLELLKGEYLQNNHKLNEKDLLESMNFSKKSTLKTIKNISNYITILIIFTISLFIMITNIKSIVFENQTFDFSNYFTEEEKQIMIPREKPTKELIEELNQKLELILTTQGNYTNSDYTTIKTHINILKDNLTTQENEKYLKKTIYTFYDLLNFYLAHQNLLTYPLDNKDLYPIILKYNSNLSDNLLQYNYYETLFNENYFNIYSYLEQPYHISSRLPFKNYEPDPYYVIKIIYQKELILINDIIEAGDIK